MATPNQGIAVAGIAGGSNAPSGSKDMVLWAPKKGLQTITFDPKTKSIITEYNDTTKLDNASRKRWDAIPQLFQLRPHERDLVTSIEALETHDHSDKKFTRFPRLPLELRRLVWDCLEPRSRVLRVSVRQVSILGHSVDTMVLLCDIPVLFHVDKESRAYGKFKYPLQLFKDKHGNEISVCNSRFSPATDTVDICRTHSMPPSNTYIKLRNPITSWSEAAIKSVQTIILGKHYWDGASESDKMAIAKFADLKELGFAFYHLQQLRVRIFDAADPFRWTSKIMLSDMGRTVDENFGPQEPRKWLAKAAAEFEEERGLLVELKAIKAPMIYLVVQLKTVY